MIYNPQRIPDGLVQDTLMLTRLLGPVLRLGFTHEKKEAQKGVYRIGS